MRYSLKQYTLAVAITVVFAASAIAQQPNIIHIIADDMGWTDLATGLTNLGNGSQFYQTPNIDRLAQEGLSFTNAYATPTCVPTRMALMSGQSGARTRTYAPTNIQGGEDALLVAPDNNNRISNTTQTLAETLQTAGYTTAHVGKFHITRNENAITRQHGFDVNYGGANFGDPGSYLPTESNNQWTYPDRVGAAMDAFAAPYTESYVADSLQPFSNGADVASLVGTPKHLTDATADAAIDFIDGQLGASEPFYMNLAFHAVHTPIEPRADLLAKYRGLLRDNGNQSPDSRHDDASYAAMLEGMDQAIGRLMSYLENPDGNDATDDSIASNTLIVFYGDNGGTLRQTSNSPLQRGKGALLEGGIRVPMIAYQPGSVPAGTTSTELVQPVDFYQTFASVAGAALPGSQPLDGTPIASLTGQQTESRSAAHFHFPGYANAVSEPTTATILHTGDFQTKVHYQYSDRSIAIHELTTDIGEAVDLAGEDMTAASYKLGARAIVEMRQFLDDADADFPQTREGVELPAPGHLPVVEVDLDGDVNANLGLAVSIAQTDAGPQLTVNRDVMLKSLAIDANSLADSESISLSFIQGDNPFLSLAGYDSDEFTATEQSLSVAGSIREITDLEFGTLVQTELMLTAGTVIAVTGSDAAAFPVLESIRLAEPLASLGTLLLDTELDGVLDTADVDRICNAVRLDPNAVELDQNGDDSVSIADVEQWLQLTQNLNGDADLNGSVEFADFLRLSQNFSGEATWSEGDFDCNGIVEFPDFLLLSGAFGQTSAGIASSTSSTNSVPEPAAHLGLLAGCLFLLAMRRRAADHCTA